jgi:uncharacterized SAM-binding protein YcdF (DUF218 family)
MGEVWSARSFLSRVVVDSTRPAATSSFPASTASLAWGGNTLMAEFVGVLRARGALEGRTAISLGSGLGQVDLCLAACGASSLATDLPEVVPALRRTLAANGALLDSTPGTGSVRAAALDWTAPLPLEIVNAGPFDAILASDCVYWPSLFAPLVATLTALVALASDPSTVDVYLALEVRPDSRKENELAFFTLLDAAGFRWYRIDDSPAGCESLARSEGSAVGLFWARRLAGGSASVLRQLTEARARLPPAVARAAEAVWGYMTMRQPLQRCDLILVLCSNDRRVAEFAARLWLRGWAPRLMFSGGVGELTKGLYGGMSEGAYFARVATDMGVPSSAITVEGSSTNTGENVALSAALVRHEAAEAGGWAPTRVLLVQKPFMERRSLATFEAQGRDVWASLGTRSVRVTSPPIPFSSYPLPHTSGAALGLDVDGIVSVMAGDLQRIATYPTRGFQSLQAIPASVWAALHTLLAAGYSKHLVKGPGGVGFDALEVDGPVPACVVPD